MTEQEKVQYHLKRIKYLKSHYLMEHVKQELIDIRKILLGGRIRDIIKAGEKIERLIESISSDAPTGSRSVGGNKDEGKFFECPNCHSHIPLEVGSKCKCGVTLKGYELKE